MNLALTCRLALRALSSNKMRTLLTMLGIIIGVGSVIAMLSIGSGAKSLIDKRIEGLGTNCVFVWPGRKKGRNRGAEGGESTLVVKDWKALDRLPEVLTSAPIAMHFGQMVYGSANWQSSVYGTTPEYLLVRNWPVAEGRMFNRNEIASANTVCVLGVKVKQELFGSANPIGETIRIGNLPFRVIGILSEKGASSYGSRDNVVMVPYTTVMRKLKNTQRVSYLALSARSKEEVKPLEKIAVDFLNQRYNITDPSNGGFGAFNQAEASDMADKSTKIFSLLLGGIASISLLVGGIGIMNIMLVSVTERTREIGIRMAVGARGRDILSQFLVEAVILSLLGGALGILLGGGLSHLIASYAGWPPTISTGSIIIAFGTSASIGVFFGFYPAISASRLDPIEALRYE